MAGSGFQNKWDDLVLNGRMVCFRNLDDGFKFEILFALDF